MDKFFITLQDKQKFVVQETLVIDGNITPDKTPTDMSPLDTIAPFPTNKPLSEATTAPLDLAPLDTTTAPLDKPLSDAIVASAPAYEPLSEDATTAPLDKPLSRTTMAPLHLTPLNTATALSDKPLSGATKLRRMIFETQELVVCPGVYDGLSARTALEVGFQALYMVSSTAYPNIFFCKH